MPQPPQPNAIRALIGFPIGMVVTLVIVGIIRKLVWGLGVYLVDIESIFAGWFWEDEATLMFAMFGGAMGFVWGSGALYDFSAANAAPKEEKRRIPTDPDAPTPIGNNPLRVLFEALPSVGTSTAIMLLATALLIAIPLLGGIPFLSSISPQTVNESGDTGTFGKGDFNLLGIIKVENASQATMFVIFAIFVIVNILGIAATIAFIFYLLNRQVRVATEIPPTPQDGNAFLPIRLVSFFTDWAMDVLNGVSSALRPR